MTDYTGASAIVIGGSIGGLTTALLLRDLGFTVDVYERTATALDGRGSGIVLQPDTVRWFTERSTQDLGRPQHVDLLRAVPRPHRRPGVPGEVHLDLHLVGHLLPGAARRLRYRALPLRRICLRLRPNRRSARRCGSSAAGWRSADLVVFADGVTSVARERFDADAGLRYSGYIGWRGTVPVRDLDAETRECLADAITYDCRSQLAHHHVSDSRREWPRPRRPADELRLVPQCACRTRTHRDVHRQAGIPGAVSVHPVRCRTATSTR